MTGSNEIKIKMEKAIESLHLNPFISNSKSTINAAAIPLSFDDDDEGKDKSKNGETAHKLYCSFLPDNLFSSVIGAGNPAIIPQNVIIFFASDFQFQDLLQKEGLPLIQNAHAKNLYDGSNLYGLKKDFDLIQPIPDKWYRYLVMVYISMSNLHSFSSSSAAAAAAFKTSSNEWTIMELHESLITVKHLLSKEVGNVSESFQSFASVKESWSFQSYYELVPKLENCTSDLILKCMWEGRPKDVSSNVNNEISAEVIVNCVNGIIDKENHFGSGFLCKEVLRLYTLTETRRSKSWIKGKTSDFVSADVDSKLSMLLRNETFPEFQDQREHLDFIDKWWILCKDVLDEIDLHDCFAALVESLESNLYSPQVNTNNKSSMAETMRRLKDRSETSKKLIQLDYDEWLKRPLDFLIQAGAQKLLIDYIDRFSQLALLHADDINDIMISSSLGSDDEMVFNLVCLHRSLEFGEFLKANLGPLFPHEIICKSVHEVLHGLLEKRLLHSPDETIHLRIPLENTFCSSFIQSIRTSSSFDILHGSCKESLTSVAIDLTQGEPPYTLTAITSERHPLQ